MPRLGLQQRRRDVSEGYYGRTRAARGLDEGVAGGHGGNPGWTAWVRIGRIRGVAWRGKKAQG